MGRVSGRFGLVYINLLSGGTAEPIAFLSSWTLQSSSDRIEVTAMGDKSKVYIQGLPDAQGQFEGYYDDSSVQTYQAASDGIARKFYLYPNINTPGQYFWGTVFTDFSASSAVNDAVKVSSSWSAATSVTKVG